MLVCNCRGINQKQVNLAVKGGATYWAEVHTCYGAEPACGKCRCEIEQAIAAHSSQNKKIGPAPLFSTPALAKPA